MRASRYSRDQGPACEVREEDSFWQKEARERMKREAEDRERGMAEEWHEGEGEERKVRRVGEEAKDVGGGRGVGTESMS